MKLNNRYIPYGRQWIDNEDISSAVSILRSDTIARGPKVKEFEETVAAYCQAKYAVAVSSGTAALHIACLASEIDKGDEVITTPISFVASSNCILYCGGNPVFADIQNDTININPQEIVKKISKKTKAIITVHFAGHPCDLKEIRKIADKYNLKIIEDAAHALGAEYRGTKIGSCKYSDMVVLSFHPVKHITTGEGGMVLTNSKDLYKKLIAYRNHGIIKDRESLFKKDEGRWYYEMQLLGFNYWITDFQCALGISQFEKLEKFVENRRQLANFYYTQLHKVEAIELPTERNYIKSAWHIYVIRIKKNRKKVFNRLMRFRIGVNVHYGPIYLHPFYQKLGYQKGLCPEAETYYSQALTIPLYPHMAKKDAAYVVDKLKESLN